jgi:hypothetical protein
MSPLQQLSWRVFFWLLPAYGLWSIIVTPVILTPLATPVKIAAEAWFEREQLELTVLENGRWHLDTKILLKKQPEYGKRRFVLNRLMESLIGFTLGLPLLWAFLMATPEGFRLKLGKLLLGSLLLALSIGMALWLRIVFWMGEMMAGDEVDKIYIMTGIYSAIHPYPNWLMKLLAVVVNASNYLNAIIIPMLIWYFFNRRFIRVLVLVRCLMVNGEL